MVDEVVEPLAFGGTRETAGELLGWTEELKTAAELVDEISGKAVVLVDKVAKEELVTILDEAWEETGIEDADDALDAPDAPGVADVADEDTFD